MFPISSITTTIIIITTARHHTSTSTLTTRHLAPRPPLNRPQDLNIRHNDDDINIRTKEITRRDLSAAAAAAAGGGKSGIPIVHVPLQATRGDAGRTTERDEADVGGEIGGFAIAIAVAVAGAVGVVVGAGTGVDQVSPRGEEERNILVGEEEGVTTSSARAGRKRVELMKLRKRLVDTSAQTAQHEDIHLIIIIILIVVVVVVVIMVDLIHSIHALLEIRRVLPRRVRDPHPAAALLLLVVFSHLAPYGVEIAADFVGREGFPVPLSPPLPLLLVVGVGVGVGVGDGVAVEEVKEPVRAAVGADAICS